MNALPRQRLLLRGNPRRGGDEFELEACLIPGKIEDSEVRGVVHTLPRSKPIEAGKADYLVAEADGNDRPPDFIRHMKIKLVNAPANFACLPLHRPDYRRAA
jgi:hypothetical protein